MLDSVKIARRQSEIRQALAELEGTDKPTDDETRSMETMTGLLTADVTVARGLQTRILTGIGEP